MERRKAVTAAAAASFTLLAGAAGIAVNSGIVGAGADGKVGQLSPVGTTSPPVTVYVDEVPPLAPAPNVTMPPVVQPTDRPPVATSEASPSAAGGDDHERGEVEHEDHAEYEGGGDDD